MIGYTILSLASACVWIWPAHSELLTPLQFSGPLGETSGEVLTVESSGVYGSREPSHDPRGRLLQFAFMVSPLNAEVELLRITFSYSVDGTRFESQSFAPSTSANLPNVGSSVPIEYVRRHPQRARVAGMAYHAYGWQVVWTFFFPLIGLALVLPRLLSVPAHVELLRTGQISYGTLVNKLGAKDAGGFKILEFEFRATAAGADARPPVPDRPAKASDGAYLRLHNEGAGVYKTWLVELATKSVEDELWEPILYLPRDPNVACLLDALDVVPTDEWRWEKEAAWEPKRWSVFWFVLARPVSLLAVNLVSAAMLSRNL